MEAPTCPTATSTDTALDCSAFREGHRRGAKLGATRAEDHVIRTTSGGYRLRRVVSLSLGGAAGLLAGLLAGIWMASRLRRRRGIPYAERVFRAFLHEVKTLRDICGSIAPESTSGQATAALEEILAALDPLQAQASRLRKRAIEDEHQALAANERDVLEAQYAALEALTNAVARTRVQVEVCLEGVASSQTTDALRQVSRDLCELRADEAAT